MLDEKRGGKRAEVPCWERSSYSWHNQSGVQAPERKALNQRLWKEQVKRRCHGAGWGGDVLPSAKLEVTTGGTVDRRRGPITRHMLGSSSSACLSGPSGNWLLILALQGWVACVWSMPFPILSQGRQPHGILSLGTWFFGH